MSAGRSPVLKSKSETKSNRKGTKNNEKTHDIKSYHPVGSSCLLPHQAGALPKRRLYRSKQRLRLHRHRRRQCVGLLRPDNPVRLFRPRRLFRRGNRRNRRRHNHKRRRKINQKIKKTFAKPIDKCANGWYNIITARE